METGCAKGILTKEISKKVKFNNFTANDIVEESISYIQKIIPDSNFIFGDIEEIELKDKYDLIISNAMLQWCENPAKTINKMFNQLKEEGVLAVSLFGNKNLKEINTIFNISPNSVEEIKDSVEEIKILYFDSPIDVLKHLKSTGANALMEYKFTKSDLKIFEYKYRKLFTIDGKVTLTYNPKYFIFQKF